MKTFHLDLIEVDDFIPQLAQQFKIDYKENMGEYHLDLAPKLGVGKIIGINFPNGVGLYTYNCKLKQDVRFQTRMTGINPIRFIYCVEGKIESYFNENEDPAEINDHQYLIVGPRSEDLHNVILKKGSEVSICSLEIDRKKFHEYFSFDLNKLEPVFQDIFSDTKGNNRISSKGSFSLQTAETIKEVKKCEITGFPRINFIGAKALEILSYMLSRFKKEGQIHNHRLLREKELKAVEKVRDYIDQNISKVGTVNDLARIAGMNANKLQEVFQAVYGKTVNEYLRDIRLSKALHMLSNGNRNVSEVVYELGLSSRSYFSKIFKSKYGISPRKLLNQKAREN